MQVKGACIYEKKFSSFFLLCLLLLSLLLLLLFNLMIVIILVILLLSLLFILLRYFYVYFIFSFIFALLCIISCVAVFLTFKVSCMLLMILYCIDDLVLYYCVFYSWYRIFENWKIKWILFKKKKKRKKICNLN